MGQAPRDPHRCRGRAVASRARRCGQAHGSYLKKNLEDDWLEFAVQASNKRTAFSALISRSLSEVGLNVSEGKLRTISRKMLKRIADPTKLLPNALGRVAKKFGGAALAGLNVFFTSSRIATRSDDVLGGQVDHIDAMLRRARSRLITAENLAVGVSTTPPMLRQPLHRVLGFP